MNKHLFTLLFAIFCIANGYAQSWHMIVTHPDGTADTIPTKAVKDVQFALLEEKLDLTKDQNVEQLIIKELYIGGVTDNNNTGSFYNDKGFVLYNNSAATVVATHLGMGIVDPYNAHASNNWYDTDGNLKYDQEGYIPAITGVWYFQEPLVVRPYEQVVVAIHSAIDNTQTYNKSVNYAHAEYYCMYDPESGFNNSKMYPAPATEIPTNHYLKAIRYGLANAWTISNTAPAFFIFNTQGTTPQEYANDTNNYVFHPGKDAKDAFKSLKIPKEWIIDGIEVYDESKVSESKKRLPADIDLGYITTTKLLGRSLYRNVDEEATRALPENEGKLVEITATDNANAVLAKQRGTIDAEASIKKGAHIIYMDNNNSTEDFFERGQFSIKE